MLPFAKFPVLYWLEIIASIAFLFALVSALIRTGPTRGWTLPTWTFGSISTRHARRAVALVADGVMIADLRKPDFPIVYVNPAFETITGYGQADSIGKSACDLLSDGSPQEIDALRDALRKREATQVTASLRRKDGTTVLNDLRIEPQFTALGRATHCIATVRLITHANRVASDHRRSDHLDRLTGVANRNSFQDQLAQMLRRDRGQYTLLAKVDIRRFHDINISFGYLAGDALLREIGQRLQKLPDAAIGRLSGDEFAVAHPLPNADAASGVISSIQASLGTEFALPDAPFKARFAIGYTIGQRSDETTALLRRAGVALHEAKASPFLDVREFDRNAATRNENRARLTRDLQHAIEHGDLLLYYQPKVDLLTGEIVGAEALLRWDDPCFGLREPSGFIPVAEDSGLIVEIGSWCLRSAAAFAVRLNRNRSRPLVVSVNVSQLQFEYADVPSFLETVIDETGVEASWLMLELTERVLTDNSATMIRALRRLRDMGFGLSIDDFGTGHSSLSYLEAFPFSEFKIDRTFVSGLDQNRAKHIIVEAMIRLGRELQMSVTAEGAETEEELSVLRELNCPYVQGYIFGRPMTENDFAGLLNRAPFGTGAGRPSVGPAAASGDHHDTRNAILIDDDSLVREVLGGALEILGWDVTSVASAEAALALAAEFPAPRLIVTDVNLGAGMSGFELLPHARRRWPDAGIIVISGRPVEPNALAGLGKHEIFLTKPASIATLGGAISRVVVNSGYLDPGTADRTAYGRYAAEPVPDLHGGWCDLAVGSAAALAPGACSPATFLPAGVDTRNAPAPVTSYDVQTPNKGPATVSSLNVAAEVRDLLSLMARPANPQTVKLLVAIAPDITILANQLAFRGVLSRVILDAIAATGESGGRVLLTAVSEGRGIRLTVADEAEAADPVQREAALRYSDEWTAIPDCSLDVRLVPGGGIEVILTLTAA